ncbi:sigma 54-interacting transcriptional regulator [Dehalobacter sp. DCM]|uniref:sigma-54 interaction domain-containing protein n=1 Tax=Dehalobacter sp. DCM TaxID=2907827 RepID=UPI0030818BC8|nr:sigma 54-interacting transcriptional regulator [Dehalobacter sp. DCM]
MQNTHQIMTEERWEKIMQCKRDFIDGKIKDPANYSFMDKEVAASWVRSREAGVDPYGPKLKSQIDRNKLEANRKEHETIIEITKPIIATFNYLTSTSEYHLTLDDKNGFPLIAEGSSFPKDHFKIVAIASNENTIGTNSHVLSTRLKRPTQLIGPEHYCMNFENIVSSAAPILDENGNVIATLALWSAINPPWKDNLQILASHTLGLITAIATAVENKLQLQKNFDQLKEVNDNLKSAFDTLEATFSLIDEGILTVDHKGKIIKANKEGAKIFKLKTNEATAHNISEFLCNPSHFFDALKKGERAEIEDTICTEKSEQSYLINIRPIINDKTKKVTQAVLRLNPMEKLNALVANRFGPMANYTFDDLVGESKEFKNAIALGQRFARASANILITGESGTGKELFAQAIHNEYRPKGPFIAVNCAAMPRNLIESELFGYEGGSFTGADRNGRPGKIEMANEGTLFLDEIGDMPVELQAVLLRVIEDKQVMRIGGRRYKKVDFRVVAATNRNLREMIKKELFREDLYFRLSVLSVKLPPLRERGNDAEILSRFFISSYCEKLGWVTPTIGDSALKIIRTHHWPGNVRELENAMIYAVNITQNNMIEKKNLPDNILLDINDIPSDVIPPNEQSENLESLKDLERKVIQNTLIRAKYDIIRTSEILGISKSTLYRKIKEFEIEI